MDFSRLHTYTPPQCLPENTGYTYALSSSYSSSALDFETENKIDPVFDSPRMSRRSLRLAAVGYSKSDDGQSDSLHESSYAGNMSFRDQSNSSIFSQSSFNSHATDTSMVSTILDESLIREQTEVDHFWGLDEEGDPKGSDTTLLQGNGGIAAAELQPTLNGYTCSDCSMLSERKEVLTAYSASHVPSSRIYTRDRSQKHASTYFYMSKILRLVKNTAASFASLLVQLFQMVLLKLGYEYKGTFSFLLLLHLCYTFSYLSSLFESDDCKGKKHLEIHSTDHTQSSWAKRVARTIWHTFSSAGYFMLHVLQTVGATGWLVSQKVLSLLWLAILSPGRAASGMFRLLRTGWYQLVTLMSLLKVFLVRRCVSFEITTDFLALHKEHEVRIQMLEDLLRKLSEESKVWKVSFADFQLISKIKKLELELSQMKSELLSGENVKMSCEKMDVIHEKVDAQVKESIKLMLFGDHQEEFPESLLQWLTSNFVSKSDLQTLLRDLELQILKNITLHMSVTNQKVTSEVVTNAVTNAGISGITEAQAQIIVNNALKLYSQDKTGMVDFALESGGGSILSTRCSETYETKTALISLFGIPLWYFSQSPRVVIQPDMYPGNCWAFKGSQGYLVVRLSMKIYPTAFTLEHIPKTLSPTGNITSAPRNFSVYGLDDEYQEEGKLLGEYVYDQEGEPLQMFPVMKNEDAFQIVELRIFSNWGHAEYTCLYRFRVHGKPAE
uniref:Sad1 and UNC84 domain containing 1 n=1 Tax=Malurus cyaneus samueli TaxID=2593467 RepID=A0A8C5UCG2_9PASS